MKTEVKKLVLGAWCLVLGAVFGAGSAWAETPELAVSNVKAEQRWPWEGKVRFSFDLTGAGTVQTAVQLMTNDVKVCEATTLDGETTFDLADGATTKQVPPEGLR